VSHLDILLHLETYPEPTPDTAVDRAVLFTSALGGQLAAIAVETDFRVPHNILSDYLLGLRDIEKTEEGKSSAAAGGLLNHTKVRCAEADVRLEILRERAEPPYVGDVVARYARTRDLCLVPIVEGGQRSVAERVIFDSGRPALVFRPGVADLPAGVAKTIVLAWDGSPNAARAMADAMPVLAQANKVTVFTALKEKPSAVAGVGVDAVRHLQARGVAATLEERHAEGQSIGRLLDDITLEMQADLLVMGAYGRSRLREIILGGATEHILAGARVPVMLSH
jgi:nucleotide-binding universal stress UspA family protein